MSRRAPLWRLLAAAAVPVVLVPAAGPVKDFDAYWHVRLGEHILTTRSIPGHELWNFPAVGRRWVPHSWLSEVLLALAHRVGGWHGLVVLRLVVGAVLLGLVARAVMRDTDAVVGPVVSAVATLALAAFILERPQLFALTLAAAAFPLLDRARLGRPPHPLVVLALGWLWASIHGSWPLLPGALLLAALCQVVDRKPVSLRYVLGALAAVVGAATTPVGPLLLTRPFVVGREAGPLSEWQATRLWAPDGAAFTLLVAALVVAWALSRQVPTSELVWCLAIVAAALSAGRNLSFATVLLAPIVARRVSSVVPPGRRSEVPAWTVPAMLVTGLVVVGLLKAANPALATDAPFALVDTLKERPGRARVLNDYNIGGFLTGFGGDKISVAIDGRIDAYPEGFLRRYLNASDVRGGWEWLVDDLDPTHAILDRRRPLAYVLELQGWRRLGQTELYVLLERPTVSP